MRRSRATAVDRMMSETVAYGGLLVTRGDMYLHLTDIGAIVSGKSCPGGMAFMRSPAVAAEAAWSYRDGAWHHVHTGEVLA